jgi:acetyl-CoA C-acetyltransferase
MAEAMIFDTLRTPRGKGKRDGSLYEVKPVSLIAGLLRELRSRHDFDTAEVEDVVLAASHRSANRAVVSPRPRRSRPAGIGTSPACS